MPFPTGNLEPVAPATGHEKNNVAMNAVPGDPGSISFGAADQTAWLAQTQSMWATRSRKVRSRHN
jgi:hypothetical protein